MTYSVKTHSLKRISAPFLTIATRLRPLIPLSSNPRMLRLFPGLSKRMEVYAAAKGSRPSPGEKSRMHRPAPRSSDIHSIDALIGLVSLVKAMLEGPEFLVVRQEIGVEEAHTLSGRPDDAADLSASTIPPAPLQVAKVWHSAVTSCRPVGTCAAFRKFPSFLVRIRRPPESAVVGTASVAARLAYAATVNTITLTILISAPPLAYCAPKNDRELTSAFC